MVVASVENIFFILTSLNFIHQLLVLLSNKDIMMVFTTSSDIGNIFKHSSKKNGDIMLYVF